MTRINIVTGTTPGLVTCAKVVRAALGDVPGLEVRAIGAPSASDQAPVTAQWQAHLNIFIEQVHAQWLPLARRNVLIPNQEWCRPDTFALLGRLDAILCKTRHALEIFRGRSFPAFYTGFSSPDKYRPAVPRDGLRFLHVAGRSLQKGTGTLAKLWSEHPHWPMLTVVTTQPQLLLGYASPNIEVRGALAEEELVALQNGCGVHLCPSEAEGFGHTLCEALACKALVITTDAPPMNELVTQQRGLLAAWAGSKPQLLGFNFYVDPASLAACIERAMQMGAEERAALGEAGRAWFLAEGAASAQRVREAVLACLRD